MSSHAWNPVPLAWKASSLCLCVFPSLLPVRLADHIKLLSAFGRCLHSGVGPLQSLIGLVLDRAQLHGV